MNFQGSSIAGIGSCWIAPGGKVAIDAGVQLVELVQADVICLSHAHMDHIGALLWNFTMRSMRNLAPQLVLGEAKILEDVANLREAMLKFGQQSLPWKPQAVKPGDTISIGGNQVLRPFRSVHVTPTLGWSCGEVRKKLKPEFQSKTSNEMVALKKAGIEISEEVFASKWAVTSDTMIEVFDLNPFLKDVPELMIECTFVKPEQVEKAKEFGHIHVDQLAAKLQEINFQGNLTLTHFSAASTGEERAEALKRCKAQALAPCTKQFHKE